MAYRRKQQQQQQQSEKPFPEFDSYGASSSPSSSSSSSSSSSLATKAIRASSAHAQSSLSSAYTYTHTPPSSKAQDDDDDDAPAPPPPPPPPTSNSPRTPDEPKQGFWGALARKAKSIIDDSADPPSPRQHIADQLPVPSPPPMCRPKQESPPAFQKGIGAIASSLNYIGNAVEVNFLLRSEVSYDSYTKFMVPNGCRPHGWKHRSTSEI